MDNQFLHPERIISYLGIEKGMKVADFGSGHGYFTIPIARLVGEEGRIYSIDIQKDALAVIQSKAKLEHLLNVETIWSDIETADGSKLQNSSIDLVIMSNILFQAESPSAIIVEAKRVLKSGGKIALIEWDETPFQGGPPPRLRIPKEKAKKLASENNLELDREFEAGSHHYGLLLKKL